MYMYNGMTQFLSGLYMYTYTYIPAILMKKVVDNENNSMVACGEFQIPHSKYKQWI